MTTPTEPTTLTEDQLEAYLDRLGFAEAPAPTLDALNALIYAHQTIIPFETVDMHLCTTPPELTIEAVFDKAITRKRGGYCFELNLLFKALLVKLGFDAHSIFARVMYGQVERRPITHRGVLIVIDGVRHYADVGLGGPMAAGALAFDDGVIQHVQGERYVMRELDSGWWALDRFTETLKAEDGEDEPARVYTVLEVCPAYAGDNDFWALNMFCSQPGQRFHVTKVLNLRTESGHVGIDHGVLTIRENGVKRTRPLDDDESFDRAVEEHFGFKP